MLGGTQLLSIVEHDDAVTHNDTHQGNDAQHAGHTEGNALYQDADSRSEEA